MASYTKDEAQEWAWDNLHGQWSTLVTPFTPEDKVDDAGLRHNIRYIQSLGVQGAGCGWGMGEFWSLTQEERLHVQDIVADESRDQWLIGTHVTDTSVPNMLELARHAEDVGFDLLIVAPSYMVTRTEEQVIQYTRLLAENSSLAIMFYNSPQFGIVMSAQGLRRICQIPNVVGVKEASFNQQLSIETHLTLGRDAIISTPDEWIFAKAKQLGFQQQVMFANTSDWRFDTPEENQYVQFIEKATQGDLDQQFYDTHLKEIKQLSDKWWGATVQKFGGAMPVSLVKYWGELMGLSAGHVRPPLSDMTDDEKAELRSELGALRPLSSKGDSSKKGRAPTRGRASVKIPGTATQSNGSGDGGVSSLSGMLLMVSVQNLDEALEAERGGADLIDVKNLQEALVGSGHPLVVREIRERISDDRHVSVTLGVVPSQPGTVAMAVHAAAILNATSVKVGFVNTDYDTAVDVLRNARRAMDGYKTKLIGSLFADNGLHDGLDPHLMLKLAREGECDGFLIDTLTKDGRNLFDFIPEAELREMVFEGKQLGMSTALSGHLKMSDLDELARINPDIVGVRGAVCTSQDRTSAVAWEAVAEFKHALNQRKSGEVNPYADSPVASSSSNGWVLLDGRGKSCAGVIAALTKQVEADSHSFVEAIMSDALNIYDLTVWTEQAGHRMLTQRKESDGTLRVLIQPFGGSR